MTPELSPVRRRGRLGIDRGLVVVIAIVGLVGLAVLKPWGSSAPAEIAQAEPSAAANESGLSTGAIPTPSRTFAPAELSLDSVSASLASVWRDAATAWVTTIWHPDPVSVPLLDAPPKTRDLGMTCDGGALIGVGTDAFGVTLPERARPSRVTHVLLRRLFDGQSAVTVPVSSLQDDSGAVALITAKDTPWPAGHYALTLDVMGRSGTVAFCVGQMLRDVDYSLIVFVPSSADSAAARSDLISATRK